MDQQVSAADANRSFSRILRDVQGGSSYVVTSHGKPVARIVPFSAAEEARTAARAVLWERLLSQPVIDIGPWTRDELYDE